MCSPSYATDTYGGQRVFASPPDAYSVFTCSLLVHLRTRAPSRSHKPLAAARARQSTNRDTARQHKSFQAQCSRMDGLSESKVPPITLPLLQKLRMSAGSDTLAVSLSFPDSDIYSSNIVISQITTTNLFNSK